MIEIIGYLASLLVAISITINGGFYFRILNMAGAICFSIYGIFIGSIPVTLINTYGIAINIFHLIKMRRNKNKSNENASNINAV